MFWFMTLLIRLDVERLIQSGRGIMSILGQPGRWRTSYGRKLKEADSFSTANQKAGVREIKRQKWVYLR